MSNWMGDVGERYGTAQNSETVIGAVKNWRLCDEDIEILRDLGRQKKEILNNPKMEKNKKLWTATNDIKMITPPVFIDEVCWNEVDTDGELTLRCKDPWAKRLENFLRKELYRWNHIPANMVVAGYIECPMVVYDSGFGIEEIVQTAITDPDNPIVSRHFNILINDAQDISIIKEPEIVYDQERTMQYFDMLSEVFEGILPVHICGTRGLWFTPWDYLVRVTGVEETLINLALEPEFINELVARYVDVAMFRFKKYTELGLWASNNCNMRVGSGGYGYTSDLPSPDGLFTNAPASALWGCGNAQIFSEVSPNMHWEFSLQHEMRWIEQFGLSYYGCCEPLHGKLHILERIPNLRKISMSPWANLDIAAEICKGKYVLSCKPNPAIFATDTFEEKNARADIQSILDKTKDCSIELVMKDISTVRNDPQRLWKWAAIAAEMTE